MNHAPDIGHKSRWKVVSAAAEIFEISREEIAGEK